MKQTGRIVLNLTQITYLYFIMLYFKFSSKSLLNFVAKKYKEMKNLKNALLIICSLVTIINNLSAQENKPETLLKSKNWGKIGFMASPNIGFTKMDKANVITMNLRSGIIFGDCITIGGFYNFSMNEFVPKSETLPGIYMDYQAFGGFVEYTFFSNKLLHASFPLLIGGGEVEMDSKDYDPGLGEANFLVIEPGILCEINLHDYVRLNLGVTYRAVGKMSYRNLDQSAISGISAQVGLKLGLFKK